MGATAREFNLTSSELASKTVPMMVRPTSYCMPSSGFQQHNEPQGLSQKGGYSPFSGAAAPSDQDGRHGSPYSGDSVLGKVSADTMYMGGLLSSKKRGRPRRYGQYGSVELGLSPLSSNSADYASPSSEFIAKSRALGSTRKRQLDALGPAGTAFRPHMITVEAGENVVSKIMAFSRQGEHTVCILSGNGVLSNVALRQPAVAGGTVTYEGRFEIVSLSGSFTLNDDGGFWSRSGGLSVSVVGPDGRVIGGAVAGVLVADMPVQVIMCSFLKEVKKHAPTSFLKEVKEVKIDTPIAQPPPPMSGFSGHCQEGQQGQGTTPSELSSLSSDESEDEGDEEHANGGFENANIHSQNISSHASPFWMQSA